MTARLRHHSPRAAGPLLALGLVGALVASAAAGTSASNLAPIHGTYSPKIVPANFVKTIDNRYFPLKPGTTFRYKGVQEDG